MNEESRKRMTLYIGECWHESLILEQGWKNAVGAEPFFTDRCRKCFAVLSNSYQEYKNNRTFKDPADFFAVLEKLVEKGEWEKLVLFAKIKRSNAELDKPWIIKEEYFYPWLLSRTPEGDYRLCVLVDEWLKEKGGKNG
jgi:hypothetical protein